MTRDDIIRMAKEALGHDFMGPRTIEFAERFAALVAAAEREACAKVCESLASDDDDLPLEIEASSAGIIRDFVLYLAKTAIRARGETECKGMRWEHTAVVWTAPQSERGEK